MKTGLAAASVKRNWTVIESLRPCRPILARGLVHYLVLHAAIVGHAGVDR